MQPLYLKLAFPLLLAAAAHGATLPSLVQTRFKLHTGPTQQRVHNAAPECCAPEERVDPFRDKR